MFLTSKTHRAFALAGLVALGVTAASEASAFGLFGGLGFGGFGIHVGGGGFGGPRMGFGPFGGFRVRRFADYDGPRYYVPRPYVRYVPVRRDYAYAAPRRAYAPPVRYTYQKPAYNTYQKPAYSSYKAPAPAYTYRPATSYQPATNYQPATQAYAPQPQTYAPQAQAPTYAPQAQAPASSYQAMTNVQPAAQSYAPQTPPAAAPAAVEQPTVVSVMFLPTATTTDVANFMRAYNITVSNGPSADGVYRVQISTGPVSQDQLNAVIESMQSQTAVVSKVGS